MGEILASEILNKAAQILFDVSNMKWPQAELLGWLNDGQRAIVLLDPTANADIVALQLVTGARQTLPADGYYLLDCFRNLGTDGMTQGPIVRIVSKRLMDAFNPSWPIDPSSTTVSHFIYDIQDPLHFWCYPPSPGGNYIEINYCQTPAELTATTQAIDVNDAYANALMEYVLFRAYTKDADFAGAGAKAAEHYQAFTSLVAGKTEAQVQNDPAQSLIPQPPLVKGNET